MCSGVKRARAEGQGKTENEANILERELESLGLCHWHWHSLMRVPRAIQRHPKIYTPHSCPYLLGEPKEKEMTTNLCELGSITR